MNATCHRQVLTQTKTFWYVHESLSLNDSLAGEYMATQFTNIKTNLAGTNYSVETHLATIGDVSGKDIYFWIYENPNDWAPGNTPHAAVNLTTHPSLNGSVQAVIFDVPEYLFAGTVQVKNYTILWRCPSCSATDYYVMSKDNDVFGHSYAAPSGSTSWSNFSLENHEHTIELRNYYRQINEIYNSTYDAYLCPGCVLYLNFQSTSQVYNWTSTCSKQDHINQTGYSTITVTKNYPPYPNITSISPNPAEAGQNVTVSWTYDYTNLAPGIIESYVNLTYANGTFIARYQGSPFTIPSANISLTGTYNLTAYARNSNSSNIDQKY